MIHNWSQRVKTESQQSQGVINESKFHWSESQRIKNELQGATTCQKRVMTSRNESELDKNELQEAKIKHVKVNDETKEVKCLYYGSVNLHWFIHTDRQVD